MNVLHGLSLAPIFLSMAPPVPPEVLAAAYERARARSWQRRGRRHATGALERGFSYVFVSAFASFAFLYAGAWASDTAMQRHETVIARLPRTTTSCLQAAHATCSFALHRSAGLLHLSPGGICGLSLLIGLALLRQAYINRSPCLRVAAVLMPAGGLANACAFWRWGGVPDFIPFGHLLVSPGDILFSAGAAACLAWVFWGGVKVVASRHSKL